MTKPTKFSFTDGRKKINGKLKLQMLHTDATQNACWYMDFTCSFPLVVTRSAGCIGGLVTKLCRERLKTFNIHRVTY